jgi:hypothetical protein
MPTSDRWIPVLERFLEIVARRIIGLHGNPATIKPSPWGFHPGPHPGEGGGEHRHRHEATGKAIGVVYDRFGDFEGFHLLTEEGHERIYRSQEAEIERLVRYAWLERVVITVVDREHRPEVPVRVILKRAPSRLDLGDQPRLANRGARREPGGRRSSVRSRRGLAAHFHSAAGSARSRSISVCAWKISFITLTRWITSLVLPGVTLRSAVTLSSRSRNSTRVDSSVLIRRARFI